jgi:aldehyde:ferredoxin oxidoreductase
MATPGFAGKILLVNLTKEETSSLDSAKYEAYGGGHGTAAAIFWDLCVAPGEWDMQDAFDPRNVVSLMSGPLAGTGLSFASRTSVSGMSPECWPVQWFCHSNFGGSFSSMLKLAGWDGVVVVGRADSPVYINIVDDKVTLEDAKALWGLTTWETQEEIWKRNPIRYGSEWQKLPNGYTLQRPSIVTIGPAGENMTRVASLVHAGGSGAGQGGFGGVFGSKNLKAITVIGTGSIKVADPKGLREAKEWWETKWPIGPPFAGPEGSMPSSCMGCRRGCHNRNQIYGVDSDNCAEATWYAVAPPYKRTPVENQWKSTDIAQKLGLNAMETCFMGPMSFQVPKDFPIQPQIPAYTAMGWYLKKMYDFGVIGPGKQFDTSPLPMDQYDKAEFAEIYGLAIAKRIGIGNLLAEGTVRFAERLGRLPADFDVWLRLTAWGYQDHWSMPGVEWAYGNLMDSRDINNHDMSLGRKPKITCEQFVNILASRTAPYNDPFWWDYSWQGEQAYKTGIYSGHKAQWTAWHQHYATYYKESVLLCDWAFSNLYNQNSPDGKGYTSEAEPRFLKAVTGRDHSFNDGIEIGRRAWNMKNAIFVMQGRHRDQEKFAGYMYRPGASYCGTATTLPVFDGSKWEWANCRELYLDDKGVEQWKTEFYKVEGWDPKTGYPTRKTLEDLGLKYVADALQSKNKLGSA